jgi:hypothetical protein
VPSVIVFPAGATQIQFAVDAIDNTVADGNATVTVFVHKQGFVNQSASVTIIDDESAT